MTDSTFSIAVLAGDGVGPDLCRHAIDVLNTATTKAGGFGLDFQWLPAGAGHYKDTGDAFPADSVKRASEADAILVGAMGVPGVSYPDGGEIAPQLDLRFELDLYAGLRPIRSIPGVSSVLADKRANAIDLMIVRESTEGLFASVGRGGIEDDQVGTDYLVVTRKTSERLFDRTFEVARSRKAAGRPGRVACVDKGNIFKSLAFFRQIFDERAKAFPDIEKDYAYVDGMAQQLVLRPWDFDVMVMENMFGDILGDLGVALIGGMNYAPSANLGDTHGVFQPCHGSSYDLAGRDQMNPTAMLLSGAMMLDWLGDKHGLDAAKSAATMIERAVDSVFVDGTIRARDIGGTSGTSEIVEAVKALIEKD